jgi:hypothetical protein
MFKFKLQLAKTLKFLSEIYSFGVGAREEGPDSGTAARELEKTEPGKWGCVQACELWSPKEEAHMRRGHNRLLKFGKVAGSMSCVEKEFKLAPRKWEEYGGLRFFGQFLRL